MKTYAIATVSVLLQLFASAYFPAPFFGIAVLLLVLLHVGGAEISWAGVFAPVWAPLLFNVIFGQILGLIAASLLPLIQSVASSLVPTV